MVKTFMYWNLKSLTSVASHVSTTAITILQSSRSKCDQKNGPRLPFCNKNFCVTMRRCIFKIGIALEKRVQI